MPIALTSGQVWQALEREIFAVLAWVTPRGEPRTAGIVYAAKDRRLYIATGLSSIKARHLARAPHVSLTVTVTKRIPLLPWIKIPAATITVQGLARVLPASAADPGIRARLLRGLTPTEQDLADLCFIEVTPAGEFLTYGIGVSLMTMRRPEAARGRAPV
jgi:nitroimidazol reductase NimA-like FMN-containing flavoprotein (pyridoxamine 5'-phosphate oxidase superfamily)